GSSMPRLGCHLPSAICHLLSAGDWRRGRSQDSTRNTQHAVSALSQPHQPISALLCNPHRLPWSIASKRRFPGQCKYEPPPPPSPTTAPTNRSPSPPRTPPNSSASAVHENASPFSFLPSPFEKLFSPFFFLRS